MESFLDEYIFRVGDGRKLRFRRMRNTAELPVAERLICALIAGDAQSAAQLCRLLDTALSASEFCAQLAAARLCNFALQQIERLELQQAFGETYSNEQLDVLQTIRRSATAEVILSEEFEDRLAQLQVMLDDLLDVVCWTKGTALRVTHYAGGHYRVPGDFDLLVKPQNANALAQRLLDNGFKVIDQAPEFCPQRGSGPFSSVQDLFLVPSDEFVPCEALAFWREGWPAVELKFDPFDRGLRMKEQERFFDEVEKITFGPSFLQVPSEVDQFMLSAVHLHKHSFLGWQWLLDIKLLAQSISESNSWDIVVKRCRTEAIEHSAFASLAVVNERFGQACPPAVLEELRPSGNRLDAFSYCVSPRFMWNLNSLPVMLANSMLLQDRPRKRKAVAACLAPRAAFLRSYYFSSPALLLVSYLIHLLVLLFPSGVIRRTIGKVVWRNRSHFQAHD